MKRLVTIAAIGLVLGFASAAGAVSEADKAVLKKAHEGAAGGSSEAVKVEKATGADAYTVAEIHAKADRLGGKKVSVRGKVVKASVGIMNRNWIHLRDGSGEPSKRTNNLVFTSQEAPEVGDVVTATGTLATDRDFGSGYLYPVIVENAKFRK